MIGKLQKVASEEADQKAYCDKESAETAAKKESKTAELDALKTKLESAEAKSAKLKEEVSVLSKSIVDKQASMAKWTQLRQEEHATYLKDTAELKAGIAA